ncbi:Tetratricopeptide-like helical [Penicillium concentricum]|uniref:Tetratricopeptide-like helical n=1 Tax=Penicillium concentricum TaxID=293559 RepID=A0A9W9RAF9_9EURO|nr:Tetratricopeptide-like helical [Penicillium concentricum]KAJ5356660.1 Tetratricopeptide-like helical [Penicillium concentricum]
MFEELGRALPRFRKYEQELPITKALEEALVATYTEIILFCAHSIAFFRNNPNIAHSRSAWSRFSNEFPKVMKNIRHYSRVVDETADMIRLSRETHSADTIDAMSFLQDSKPKEMNIPCYMIPYGLNNRFFGRPLENDILKNVLDSDETTKSMKVVSIYGTGGVGKTQLALHYANTSADLFDVIVWIPSETQIKFTQALAKFASKLGVPKADDTEDEYQSIQKVRDWLNVSGKTFLLIFDNVEDHKILEQLWPASTNGSVIITCRSHSVATKRTTDLIDLQCFAAETGTEVLFSLTGLKPASEEDAAAARELFWDVSFQSLSTEGKMLLNMLAFFDSDAIPEWLLSNPRANITEPCLSFLLDDFELGDAIISLTRASLIVRSPAMKAITLHRLIQSTVFSRLPEVDVLIYLDCAIQMLSSSFPNSWIERTNQQGHGWKLWQTCSVILPHVSRLMILVETHSLKTTNVELFAELIFRAGTYLWEREQPTTARYFFEYGLSLEISHSTRNYAHACRLLGHIALDLAQPDSALSAYQRALTVREKLEKENSPPIADVYDSIACSYTEQGMVTEAFQYLSKAAAIHNAHNPLHMARTHAIYAMTYLRAEQPEEALVALKKCWELQNLTEEQIIDSKYPKHSGDIVLLARIKYAQGLKPEAQQLASRTISIRRGLFGDKGPRVADSMFLVARMLVAADENVLAAKMLRAIVDMSRGVSEMQGHLARALWFLGSSERRLGNAVSAEQLKVEALNERNKLSERSNLAEENDHCFESLVGWMLW